MKKRFKQRINLRDTKDGTPFKQQVHKPKKGKGSFKRVQKTLKTLFKLYLEDLL